MNEELIQKARALLALREKATPGPWVLDWNVSRLDVLSSCSAHLVATLRRSAFSPTVDDAAKSNAHMIAAAHDMADTIAELLDKFEMLQWRCDNLMKGINVLGERADAAEARLRELASAEPVAVIAEEYGQRYINWGDHSLPQIVKAHPVGTAFILRPEMP